MDDAFNKSLFARKKLRHRAPTWLTGPSFPAPIKYKYLPRIRGIDLLSSREYYESIVVPWLTKKAATFKELRSYG